MIDIADLQYHPYPDSKFANKFEETFCSMKCTHPMNNLIVDDKLSKFEISMQDDDLSNLDLMPPPTFSSTIIPQFYKYLTYLSNH